jgi:hypothetical protein
MPISPGNALRQHISQDFCRFPAVHSLPGQPSTRPHVSYPVSPRWDNRGARSNFGGKHALRKRRPGWITPPPCRNSYRSRWRTQTILKCCPDLSLRIGETVRARLGGGQDRDRLFCADQSMGLKRFPTRLLFVTPCARKTSTIVVVV